MGAVDFIAKPFNAEDLLRKVEKALATPHPAKSVEMSKEQKPAFVARTTVPKANGVLNKLMTQTDMLKQKEAGANQASAEEIEYL
jgi:FixJ family two-component response regulator